MTGKNRWEARWENLRYLDTIWVGAHELFEQIESTLHHNQQNQIPYNLIKTETGYRIDVAVAGFTRNDIAVKYNEGTQQLEISGNKEKEDEKVEFITKRIAARSFEYKWKVDPTKYKIGPVTLKDGILSINVAKTNPSDTSTVRTFDIS